MNNDSELIFENYKAVKSINAKQLMLESTFKNFERYSSNVRSLEEAYAILDIYEMLEEAGFLQGLKNVGRGAINTAKAAGSNIAAGAQQLSNAAKAGATGAAAGIKQVGSNIADMQRTGAAVGQGQQVIKQAATAAQQIIDLVNQAKQISPETFAGSQGRELAQNISNLKLSQIMGYLDKLSADTNTAAQAASDKGIFGGAGRAAKQAASSQYQQSQQAAQPATATQPA